MQVVVEKLTPERRRELTRSTLIDAAADVFAKRVFPAASLEEIAETAGFTRGAIYKNFENKEELFFAVIERRIDAQLSRFREVLREDQAAATDPSRLAAIWEEVLAFDRDWFTLDLEFRLYAMRNEDARKTWIAHENLLRGLVAVLAGGDAQVRGRLAGRRRAGLLRLQAGQLCRRPGRP